MEPECTNNPIKEFISLSSKCYSYIYKNDIENNKNKLKNNIIHTKEIANFYKNKYIDHILLKKTLIENINLIKYLLIIFQLKINRLKPIQLLKAI